MMLHSWWDLRGPKKRSIYFMQPCGPREESLKYHFNLENLILTFWEWEESVSLLLGKDAENRGDRWSHTMTEMERQRDNRTKE